MARAHNFWPRSISVNLHDQRIPFLGTEVGMKRLSTFLFLLSIPILGSACMPIALRLSPSLFPNMAESIFEECDPELANSAIPANLKLLEGILKNDPRNRQILTTLSMGFSGYSMLFVEDQDPRRASILYRRSRDYGIRALGPKGFGLRGGQTGMRKLKAILETADREDLEALFWTTVSWNAWIYLNLDRPAAIAQITAAQACLERVMEIDPTFFQGLPYALMGVSLSARSAMFGGDVKRAKAYFDKALDLTERRFFLTQYLFAKHYAVRVQDKKLFLQLLKEVVEGDAGQLRDVCLINRVMQKKAEQLSMKADEFFF